jgi:uncharacterized protein
MNTLKNLGLVFCLILLITSCNNVSNIKPGNISQSDEELNIEEPIQPVNTDLIMESALNGDLQILKEALKNGFTPNTVDANKRTALMLAAFNGHTELVQFLIEKGADVNLTDTIHRTALMYASTGPFVETVVSLLEAGADPNLVDNEEKWTAVMMAASEGQLEVLKTLIAHGADINMVDIDQESSLDFAKSNVHDAVAAYIESLK